MFRKWAVAAALLLLTTPAGLFALGLGDIDMQSALNQPMRATIELTSAAGVDLSEIKVSIASREAHARAGLSRAGILSNFGFSVEQGSDGQSVIRVSSRDPVREPFLEFLLQLDWSNGRLMRQYTVLVDPPVTMPAAPAIPAPPVTRVPEPVQVSRAPEPAPAPAVSEPVAAPTPVTARPVPAARPPAETAPAPADFYGPVRRSETLWEISSKVRPGADVTMDQMMIALQRANPNAFIRDNINNLKTDVTLRIPDRAEILSMSAGAARAEAQRQYAEWKQARRQPPAEAPPVETAAAEPAATGEVVAEAAGTESMEAEARLQLVAPEGEAVEGAATTGNPSQAADEAASADKNLQQQLILANEEAEASRAESEELQVRVSELEGQIETMKRLLELKDDQLASLQQQLGLGVDEMPLAPEVTSEGDEAATVTGEEEGAMVADAGEQPPVDEAETASGNEAPQQTAPEEESAQEPEEAATIAGEPAAPAEPRGIVNRVMDNPVLAGLGVLVALLLGAFLWASTRQRDNQGMFDEEPTLEKYLAEEAERGSRREAPVLDIREHGHPDEPEEAHGGEGENDPITEADVYLAYGRTRQAEEVLQNALQESPEDIDISLRLLEFYHDVGNAAAFESLAARLHRQLPADDEGWQRVAMLGMALDPANELYTAEAAQADKKESSPVPDTDTAAEQETTAVEADAAAGEEVRAEADTAAGEEVRAEAEAAAGEEVRAEADATAGEEAVAETANTGPGSDDSATPAEELPPSEGLSEVIEFTKAEPPGGAAGYGEEDELSEGLLGNSDEVSTKLDLARAYIDMGDPEGARSILEEVIEEGGADQKTEAESLISKLA